MLAGGAGPTVSGDPTGSTNLAAVCSGEGRSLTINRSDYCVEAPELVTTRRETTHTLTRRLMCSRPSAITTLKS